MKHAFFADAGRFVLRAPIKSEENAGQTIEGGNQVTFPLDAKQLCYLVQKGFVQYPNISKDEISDKNKTDPFVRVVAVGQTGYFIVNCIGRAAQHLAITTLELTTTEFVACSVATIFFWSHKPSDVETAIYLQTNVPIETNRSDAGQAGLHHSNLLAVRSGLGAKSGIGG